MYPIRLLHRAPVRAFHSPFVVLNAANRFSPSQSTPSPVYEKQHDASPEPHLSSSGTRTYLVSEPDPSNAPYEVPTGAYPASASYANFNSATTPNNAVQHSHTVSQRDAGVGQSAAQKNTEVSGELGRRGIGLHTKTGRF